MHLQQFLIGNWEEHQVEHVFKVQTLVTTLSLVQAPLTDNLFLGIV
jgi:hypothetical protein